MVRNICTPDMSGFQIDHSSRAFGSKVTSHVCNRIDGYVTRDGAGYDQSFDLAYRFLGTTSLRPSLKSAAAAQGEVP